MTSISYSRSIKRTIIALAIVFTVPVLAWLALFTYATFFVFPSETTDINEYSNIRNQWPTEIVNHFPTAIPDNAQDVRFSAFPGFLQGGAEIQLSYQLPANEIEQLLHSFQKQERARYQGGGGFDYVNKDRENGLPIARYETGNSDEREFPPDFTIIVLGAKDYRETDEEPPWNHGHTYGLSISTTERQTVFWAEQW